MSKRWPLVGLFLSVLVYFGGQSLFDIWANYLWYRSNGQVPVYLTILTARSAVFLLIFLVFYLVLSLSLRPLIKELPTLNLRFPGREGSQTPIAFSAVKPYVMVGAGLIAFFVAISQSGTQEALRFIAALNAPTTLTKDPALHLPVGFYLFHLPVYNLLTSTLLDALLLAMIASTLMGFFSQSIAIESDKLRVHPTYRQILMLLAGGVFGCLSIEALLMRTETVLSTHQVLSGASYVDVHARIPAASILAILLLLSSIAFLFESVRSRLRFSHLLAGASFIFWIGGLILYPLILSRFVVLPNQFNLEKPYILNNIAGTRSGFHINTIRSERISNLTNLTEKDLKENLPTIRNIRLWDHRPMLTTVRQLQQIRTYYTFPILAPDRYRINDILRQVLVAPRELSYANLPSPNWINVHLTYTHGNGLIMAPVNRVSSEGLPIFWIKNIPPESSVPIKVEHSRIYYGDQPSPYAIVNTKIPEFDYPKGRQNIYNHYDGTGGIKLSSPLRRLLYSYEYGTFKIFLSSAISDKSRILVHRDLFDIVKRLAPFLSIDPDVVPVIDSTGHLLWMVDAYTTSSNYPYSTNIQGSYALFHPGRLIRSGHGRAISTWPMGLNYIRNSVKILVNPKTGQASFYAVDPSDPVLNAYRKAFPTLFKTANEIPSDIVPHLRFPPALFAISARILQSYHMTDPQVFFNREDLWSLAERDERPLSPYYMVMRLPGEQSEEYVMMLPYTPAHRDNLSAWLVGRSDPAHRGELRVYRAPKERLIYGPNQIEARIDQHGSISKQLTLWNQLGSHVVRGTLLIIPIAQSLLYVEPLYLSATSPGALPELRRVIVSMGDRVVMRKSLDQALSDLFSSSQRDAFSSSSGPGQVKTDKNREMEKLRELGAEAEKALQEGDLSTFGDRVSKILKQLRR